MSTEIPQAASSPQDFKKKRKNGELIELPSGSWMKCRQVDLTSFLREGNIPNALLSIINEALKKGEDFKIEDLSGEDDEIDIGKIQEMYSLIDVIVQRVAMDPEVHPIPENEADRSESQLYIDEMNDQDKLYLFQWSSGAVKDLETFRQESGASVAALEKVSIDQLPA